MSLVVSGSAQIFDRIHDPRSFSSHFLNELWSELLAPRKILRTPGRALTCTGENTANPVELSRVLIASYPAGAKG